VGFAIALRLLIVLSHTLLIIYTWIPYVVPELLTLIFSVSFLPSFLFSVFPFFLPSAVPADSTILYALFTQEYCMLSNCLIRIA
jgi:hypothetical protein